MRSSCLSADALKYVGIQDTARALQSGAVGGAAAVGYIAARKSKIQYCCARNLAQTAGDKNLGLIVSLRRECC